MRVGPLDLVSVSVGPMDNRSYLLTDPGSGAWLLVDAAAEPERLLALLHETLGDAPTSGGLVVTTHRHADHVGALVEVARATGARTAAGEDDADALPLPPDVRLRHGDRVAVGDVPLQVVALRGHTPGSVALLLDGVPGSPSPTCSPVTPCSPAGRGRPGHRTTSRRSWTTSRNGCSHPFPTPPPSTPVTGSPRRWGPSAASCPPGARGVGERGGW